jgi:hypothetical protein
LDTAGDKIRFDDVGEDEEDDDDESLEDDDNYAGNHR